VIENEQNAGPSTITQVLRLRPLRGLRSGWQGFRPTTY